MTTLYEQVTEGMVFQLIKHGLGEDFVKNSVNNMTNDELLHAISEALEDLKVTK